MTDDEWSEYDLGRAVLEWATQWVKFLLLLKCFSYLVEVCTYSEIYFRGFSIEVRLLKGPLLGIKPSHATGLFLFPLKKSRFSDVFRGYRKRTVAWNGLINLFAKKQYIYFYQKISPSSPIIELLMTIFQTMRNKALHCRPEFTENLPAGGKNLTEILQDRWET